MSDIDVRWFTARTLELDSTHRPGDLVDREGTANSTAAILLGDDGKAVIIEGRPADLVQLAERILQRARDIECATMVSPDLLSLYGGTEPSVIHENFERDRLDALYFEPPSVEDYDQHTERD